MLGAFKERLGAEEITVPRLTAPSCVPAVQRRQDSLPTTLRGVQESDLRCLQFLRARDFVLDEALAFYVEDRIWREQQAVDGILEEEIEQEEEIAACWPVWCVAVAVARARTSVHAFGRPAGRAGREREGSPS